MNLTINKNGNLEFKSRSGEVLEIRSDNDLYYIDLFCGAGGVSSGIVRAGAQVILCVNHDPLAIESHRSNLPDSLHAIEKIENFDLSEIQLLVRLIRQWNPNATICLWASLECTHFSKAKGGDHREADSRTLAEHLYRYIEAINPDYIDIENVIEFMSWGPLRIASEKMHPDRSDLKARKQKNGLAGYHFIPFSKRNGKYYMQWWQKICKDYGYQYDYRILNSADFGALTARTRYFGQFKKTWLPFTWPKPTHSKNPKAEGMFGVLKPWRAVRPALDLGDEGKTIFGRKKDLSENTLKRIYAGLIKYVGDGKEPDFIMKYLSNSPKSGLSNPVDLDGPAPTITTQNRLAFVNSEFIAKHYSGRPAGKVHPTSEPARTITTSANQSLVFPKFLMKYHGNGENLLSIDGPASTLTTKDRIGVINVVWLDKQYRSEFNHQSIDRPAGTIMANDKHCKIDCFIMNQFSGGTAEGFLFNHNYNNSGSSLDNPSPTLLASRKHFYLLNPQYQSKGGDLEKPCFTLIARMDKAPPYLLMADEGEAAIIVYEDDSETMQKIKLFMAGNGIIDIKMRMLKVNELLRIQGFGDQYILKGNQTDQKRFIGNSVEVNLAKKKVMARMELLKKQKAA